jgi:HK97 family phage portal protein
MTGGVPPEKRSKDLYDANTNWVFTAVAKIAQTVARTKLKIYKTKTRTSNLQFNDKWEKREWIRKAKQKEDIKEAPEDHPFYGLMQSPCPGMTRFLMWYITIGRMNLLGKSAWHHVKNGLGIPARIFIVPSSKYGEIMPVVDEKKYISGYKLVDGNVKYDIPPDELVFFRLPNLGNPFDGYSPLQAQSYIYDVDLMLLQHMFGLFKNRAVPGMVFETDENVETEKLIRLKEKWDKEHKGALAQGKTAALPYGVKLHEFGQKARDFQGEQFTKIFRDRQLSAYGVPPGKIGLVDDVNRATGEAIDTLFVRETLEPQFMLIEEQLEADFLPLYDDNLLANFDMVAPRDRELDLKEVETRLDKYVSSINEVREEILGLESVPWGDMIFVKSQDMPVNFGEDGQAKPALEKPEDENAEEEGQEGKPGEGEEDGGGTESDQQGDTESGDGRKPTEEELQGSKAVADSEDRIHMDEERQDNQAQVDPGEVHEVCCGGEHESAGTEKGLTEQARKGNAEQGGRDKEETEEAFHGEHEYLVEKNVPWTRARKEWYWRALIKSTDENERLMVSAMKKIFGVIELDMMRNLDRMGPRIQAALEGWSSKAVVTKAGEKVDEVIYSFEDWDAMYGAEASPVMRKAFQERGQAALQTLGLDIVFDLENERARKWMMTRAKKYSKLIDETTRKSLKKTLTEGFKEGEGLHKLKNRVKGVIGDAERRRSYMIARTEILAASNEGSLEGYRQSGVVEGKQWLTALDERTCPWCAPMEGQVQGLDNVFGAGTVQGPMK